MMGHFVVLVMVDSWLFQHRYQDSIRSVDHASLAGNILPKYQTCWQTMLVAEVDGGWVYHQKPDVSAVMVRMHIGEHCSSAGRQHSF
jgi:hypothetical protein